MLRPAYKCSAGFTLIEMMIVVAIIAVTLTYAVPSYKNWVNNTQIRTAAESIQNGLMRSRAEAVKRNANIEFALNLNSSWTSTVVSSGEVLDSRRNSEGSKNVTVTITPNTTTKITFTNLGSVLSANADSSVPISQIDIDNPTISAAASKNLRITIGTGGTVRMCDPNGSGPTACL